MTRDPVCGMTIDEAKAVATLTYDGQSYMFCSDRCKDAFLLDPARYARKGRDEHA